MDVDKNNEDEIIKLVCLKIEEYILNVKAKELVFISFDLFFDVHFISILYSSPT